MSGYAYETAGSIRTPSVRQLSVFLDDRVGALLRLFQSFEDTSIKILALSVVHAIDCAIVRLIVDDGDSAVRILKERKFPISETEMIVVEMPHGHGLRSICSALLTAEINIEYVYPLLVRPTGRAALAIHTDDLETAAEVLKNRNCTLLSEDDLGPGPPR
ncbi:MAG: acetolactate synthase [Planctomycetota bacterium]|nr:acetolactate synthase [Planctomycetota bacterium]MCZ6817294.1 acetolactate synthase [Planctomycetota bacterium]